MSCKAILFAVAAAVCALGATKPDMLVAPEWLASHLGDSKIAVLHVSANRNAYDAGHIPGARFVALSEIAVTRDGIPNELPAVEALQKVFELAGVSDDTRVVLYSDTSVLPATRAFFTLDYLGHDRTALLDGGLERWRREGRTLTKDAPASSQGRFTPHPKPELVVPMDAVKQLAGGKASEILLDVRPATDFKGEKGSHIPGALNLYWMDDQVSREDQSLKPDAALRGIYESLGITPDRKVVTYCNSGMQASQSYFTLKYLGYDVRLYDGSMSEWNLKGGPVEK
jgi:thiosulfate/3-mercaptopyruvate sulfurtransferase